MHITRLIVPVLCAGLLGACASRPPAPPPAPVYGHSHGAHATHGRVIRIEAVEGHERTTGTGAIVGGVAGAVVGRQFGDSSAGKNTGTVLGAIAGAVIGNQIEKDRADSRDAVRITVALHHGGTRVYQVPDAGGLRVGDRVRIEGNRLHRY